MKKSFPSKISYLVFVPMVLFLIYLVVKSILDHQWISTGVFAIICGVVVFPILINTKYTINGNVLNIRSGLLINNNIQIANIISIKSTRTILSSPALSFDRIEIFYNRYDSVIISPENRTEFIQTLQQINPSILAEL